MKIGKITDTQNNVRETGWEFQSNAMNIRKMKNSGSNIEQSIILVVLIYLEKVISVDDTISIFYLWNSSAWFQTATYFISESIFQILINLLKYH